MPYKWTLTSGSLPPGLSLVTVNSGRTGFLSGQPTAVGNYSWRYTVTDDQTPTPGSTFADYTMTVSCTLFLRGILVEENGVLPNATTGAILQGDYDNRLIVEETGVHNSTFTVSIGRR